MNNLDLLTAITVFVLSVLVGIEVISKVPATLHTPLMSGSNSVHGIVVIGAMLIAAESHNWIGYTLAFVAMVFGAMNVVGGYAVTDRMLEMFKPKTPDKAPEKTAEAAPGTASASDAAPQQPKAGV
ncbi:NAD(P) transhydrogenase subunit alpha [Streptomyces sp. NPDC047000]|uniref:NAD(P) transhydrogenase subunit alpha n=1 Tax=Streptomyces sp. NPDC047000 TaxID=3155474 RepID=UPI0033F5E2E3